MSTLNLTILVILALLIPATFMAGVILNSAVIMLFGTLGACMIFSTFCNFA